MGIARKREAGDFVAAIRYELGVTQEKMAEICDCSRSLIQKLEAGECVTEEKFVRVMEAVGINDIDYEDFFENDTKEKASLRHEIEIRLAVGNAAGARRSFEAYKKLCLNGTGASRKGERGADNEQYIKYTERLILMAEGECRLFLIEEWLKLVRITIPGYEPGKGIPRRRLSRTELMLFNTIALQLMWEGEYDRAEKIFAEIIGKTVRGGFKGMVYTRVSSELFVNLAYCQLYLDRTSLSEMLILSAMRGYMVNGGGFGLLQLLRVQLMFYEKTGSRQKYDELRFDMGSAYRCMRRLYMMKMSFSDFMKSKPGILVL